MQGEKPWGCSAAVRPHLTAGGTLPTEHLKESSGLLMCTWGHQITAFQKPWGTGGNRNKSNSWTQVTSVSSELRSQQGSVVIRTLGS